MWILQRAIDTWHYWIYRIVTYQLYKPLRNHLRKYSLLQSLAVIRAYIQHLQFGTAFPRDIQVPREFIAADNVNKNVYEWELELLVREVIINSPEEGQLDMRRYQDFSSAVNKLKQLSDAIGGSPAYRQLFTGNVLQELFRISHRQFPWQSKPNTDDFMRYFRIFENAEVNEILVRELGATARQVCALGLGLTGLFQDHFAVRNPVRIELPGLLTQGEANALIDRFSTELTELKEAMIEAQSYDQDFAYTMNPLMVTPLVWVQQDGERVLIAPIPSYILRRFTDGLYYEVYSAPGFSSAFGESFEDYTGNILEVAARDSDAVVMREQQYMVGRDRKQSIDWIMEDQSAALFIECKTKRIRYEGKLALSDTDALEADLDKMAGFIVQAYKTLADALNGHYGHWQPNGRPVFPIVVTLEEWYSIGDRIISEIDRLVTAKLGDLGLDIELMREYPYSICSIKDFEYSAFVMAQITIAEYMQSKSDEEHRFWAHGPFCSHHFGQVMANRPELFEGAWNDVVPGLR